MCFTLKRPEIRTLQKHFALFTFCGMAVFIGGAIFHRNSWLVCVKKALEILARGQPFWNGTTKRRKSLCCLIACVCDHLIQRHFWCPENCCFFRSGDPQTFRDNFVDNIPTPSCMFKTKLSKKIEHYNLNPSYFTQKWLCCDNFLHF